jgi:hypothetical protein
MIFRQITPVLYSQKKNGKNSKRRLLGRFFEKIQKNDVPV